MELDTDLKTFLMEGSLKFTLLPFLVGISDLSTIPWWVDIILVVPFTIMLAHAFCESFFDWLTKLVQRRMRKVASSRSH